MRDPHSDLPASAFWRSAAAEADPAAPAGIFAPKFGLGRDAAIATVGSSRRRMRMLTISPPMRSLPIRRRAGASFTTICAR
ncbi:hypothetical protein [Paracoccus sp. MKU1]|uniref:hypothetical protein n=1 Tax=Paracoccus sp. MKU1 TaxID=1745182 RepID=UPI00071907B1|nr:hypothetical protein [Paracoccus sp. MKU1]KRW95581.1 hypothetical protein AQY21_13855 [Paracoccus sp. MKU1]